MTVNTSAGDWARKQEIWRLALDRLAGEFNIAPETRQIHVDHRMILSKPRLMRREQLNGVSKGGDSIPFG